MSHLPRHWLRSTPKHFAKLWLPWLGVVKVKTIADKVDNVEGKALVDTWLTHYQRYRCRHLARHGQR